MEFLKDEQCPRCRGPILAEPYKKTVFHEETLDYIQQLIWVCYACGKEVTEAHFVHPGNT